MPGQRRESEESTGPGDVSFREGDTSVDPLGAVRERKRGETSDGTSCRTRRLEAENA